MARSIIQKNHDRCYLCGGPAYYNDPLDKHHVFGGAFRKKSEKYGLTVWIHHEKCHIFGENAVHKNASVDHSLKSEVQDKAMKHYGWSFKEWIEIFGRNYIFSSPPLEKYHSYKFQNQLREKYHTCVACGEIIPEGRQICINCERWWE